MCKMLLGYIVKFESTVKLFLSIIFHATHGIVCYQLSGFSFDDCKHIRTLSYYHQVIGGKNHYPLLGLGHETKNDIDVLVQERRNSITHTPESRLSCTNPSICGACFTMFVWNNFLMISSNPKSIDCPKQGRSLQTIN